MENSGEKIDRLQEELSRRIGPEWVARKGDVSDPEAPDGGGNCRHPPGGEPDGNAGPSPGRGNGLVVQHAPAGRRNPSPVDPDERGPRHRRGCDDGPRRGRHHLRQAGGGAGLERVSDHDLPGKRPDGDDGRAYPDLGDQPPHQQRVRGSGDPDRGPEGGPADRRDRSDRNRRRDDGGGGFQQAVFPRGPDGPFPGVGGGVRGDHRGHPEDIPAAGGLAHAGCRFPGPAGGRRCAPQISGGAAGRGDFHPRRAAPRSPGDAPGHDPPAQRNRSPRRSGSSWFSGRRATGRMCSGTWPRPAH